MLKHVLVTFDIDGTIFGSKTSLSVQRNSFAAAFKEFFGREPDDRFYGRVPPGATEFEIAQSIFRQAKKTTTQAEIKSFLSAYDRAFLAHGRLVDFHTFPGVSDLIERLRSMEKVHIGIASGCTAVVAKAKIDMIGFDKLFNPLIGGFGECVTRSACIKHAKAETERIKQMKVSHVVHIGDTPGDVFAARDAQAEAVAVLTGSYSEGYFPRSTRTILNMKVGASLVTELVAKLQKTN